MVEFLIIAAIAMLISEVDYVGITNYLHNGDKLKTVKSIKLKLYKKGER